MDKDKIKAFGDAIESGILIIPTEDNNLIGLAKGTGGELIHYIATIIAQMATNGNISAKLLLKLIAREVMTIMK